MVSGKQSLKRAELLGNNSAAKSISEGDSKQHWCTARLPSLQDHTVNSNGFKIDGEKEVDPFIDQSSPGSTKSMSHVYKSIILNC